MQDVLNWLNSLRPAEMCFCERTLDGFPKHPADTWSNIGPLIAGIAILWVSHGRPAPVRAIGIASVVTAVCSALFHASNAYVGEVLDLAGMYAFILSCAATQVYRHRWAGSLTSAIGGFVVAGGLTALAAAFTWAKSPLFAVVLLAVVVVEIFDPAVKHYKNAYAALAWLAVAFVFWVLDYSHVLCDPDNHWLTGHGLWHLMNGPAFWFTYKQFDQSLKDRAAALANTA